MKLKYCFLFFIVPFIISCEVLETASLIGHTTSGDVKGNALTKEYVTDLTNTKSILSICLEVGSELNYKKTAEMPEVVTWDVSDENFAQSYFGKVEAIGFHAAVIPFYDESSSEIIAGKKVIRLTAHIAANQKEASLENVEKILKPFKEMLALRLKECVHSFELR